MEMPATVELLGNERTVALPGFTEREELAYAYGQNQEDGIMLRRVYGAVIGLCTSLGAAAGANWRASKCDVLTYGGTVYGYLREQGADVEAISEVGISILAPLMVQLFPREAEVAEQAGFTAAAEGG